MVVCSQKNKKGMVTLLPSVTSLYLVWKIEFVPFVSTGTKISERFFSARIPFSSFQWLTDWGLPRGHFLQPQHPHSLCCQLGSSGGSYDPGVGVYTFIPVLE